MSKTMLSLIGIVSMSLVCCLHLDRAMSQEIGESSPLASTQLAPLALLINYTKPDQTE